MVTVSSAFNPSKLVHTH